jgi:hypothetical protein
MSRRSNRGRKVGRIYGPPQHRPSSVDCRGQFPDGRAAASERSRLLNPTRRQSGNYRLQTPPAASNPPVDQWQLRTRQQPGRRGSLSQDDRRPRGARPPVGAQAPGQAQDDGRPAHPPRGPPQPPLRPAPVAPTVGSRVPESADDSGDPFSVALERGEQFVPRQAGRQCLGVEIGGD